MQDQETVHLNLRLYCFIAELRYFDTLQKNTTWRSPAIIDITNPQYCSPTEGAIVDWFIWMAPLDFVWTVNQNYFDYFTVCLCWKHSNTALEAIWYAGNWIPCSRCVTDCKTTHGTWRGVVIYFADGTCRCLVRYFASRLNRRCPGWDSVCRHLANCSEYTTADISACMQKKMYQRYW